jgi:ParB family chromosome partitioning protein
MAEGRRGLGRGLSALLGEADDEGPAAPATGVREIPIDLIHANPAQPRRNFAQAEIDELADSIREKGILQPILVRPSPRNRGEFEIVAGERRWRAAQKAGVAAAPALVRELDDLQVLEIAIVENVQREDLNALEEALAYKALIDRFGRTQDAVATSVGKSRSHVANTLRLLQLPPAVQDHVMAGRISPGHARAIATAADPVGLAERIVAAGMSVREAETLARQEAGKPSGKPGKAGGGRSSGKDADTAALEHDLSEALGVEVEIADKDGVGELKIRYATLEQLDEICRRLMQAPR